MAADYAYQNDLANPGAYTLIRTADGAIIPPDNEAFLLWEAAGGVADPAPAIVPPSVIPVAAFWGRFTPAEQTAIMTASVSNASISGAMAFAAVVGTVDLLHGPIVAQWTTNLVAAGLITTARRTAILTP